MGSEAGARIPKDPEAWAALCGCTEIAGRQSRRAGEVHGVAESRGCLAGVLALQSRLTCTPDVGGSFRGAHDGRTDVEHDVPYGGMMPFGRRMRHWAGLKSPRGAI